MRKKSFENFSSEGLMSYLIVTLYLTIGFIPNWEAVDKIAPQWFILSVLNLISAFFFLYNRRYYEFSLFRILINPIIIIYFLFILWAGLSFFYAINPTEVIVNITRQSNIFLMVVFMALYLYNIKNRVPFFIAVVVSILAIEVYYVLNQALEIIISNGSLSKRASLKGVAANPNITAFSIANKIPFLIFSIIFIKKRIFKILTVTILFCCFLCITIIQSRASYLSIILTTLFTTIILGYSYFRGKNKKHLFSSILILGTLIFTIFFNQTIFSDKGVDAIKRFESINISQSDNSISARLRYYSHVVKHVYSNPIFGVGLGNWKLKSIQYESRNLKGYVVPYHAHSDFIQLGAELGIFGFILYAAIFILAIIFLLKLLFNKHIEIKKKGFLIALFLSLISYFIDANLNFPIARPQVLTLWAGVISLILLFSLESKNSPEKFNIRIKKYSSLIFISFSIILVIPSILVSKKVYESLKGQMFLLQDFNSNKYNISLNQVDNIVPEIPNITVTTIPINSVKARYYVNAKKYDKALALLDKGTNANPYLYYSEILKSQIFEQQGKLDSAKIYARKAFFGLPNNDMHATRYINLINITRDKKALEEAFELLTYNNKLANWKNYLIIANSLKNENDPVLIERAKRAVELFPNNTEFKNIYTQITVGTKRFNESISYSKTGLEYFNKGDHINAAKQFELAIEANPLDYANFENAATSNYLNGNLDKAVEQIDVVINDLNPLNGKCEYIKALIFIKMGDPIGACPLLETSKDSGFSQAEATFDQYCK